MTAPKGPTALLPVGTILAYAGVIEKDNLPEGWLLCGGQEMTVGSEPELFAAIGHNFGKPAEEKFNLPNLNGQFLRGRSDTSGRDPDVEKRGSLMAGGATGNSLGSYQKYGTHPAKTPFKSASIDHLDIRPGQDQNGYGAPPASYNDSSVTVGASGGGDKESRPMNKYVHFIIKSKMVTSVQAYVVPPIGAVIPFAAGVAAAREFRQSWLLCNGEALAGKGVYAELFKAIQFAHGEVPSDPETMFALPDYQGYFLRGVDSGAKIDPDSDLRTAPCSNGTGNQGDRVGSVQVCATGLPTGASLDTTFEHLPTHEASKRVALTYYGYAVVNPETTLVNLTTSGGDSETRPINYYVDWYIRFA